MSIVQFSSSCLLYGTIPSTAFLAVREMSFCAYCASKIGAFPILRFDSLYRFSCLDALFAIFVVLVFSVGFASTHSADQDTQFFTCYTSFGFFVLMLHACLVGTSELPTDVALYKVNPLFPVVRRDYGGKHDEAGCDDLVCNRVVWVDNGEADVPVICVVWYFCSCPVWLVCESDIIEEGV